MKNRIKSILKILIYMPRKLEILLIEFYQRHISKGLGKRCIYYPTCSEYTKQAIDKYGIIRGNILGIFRILRCNPFSKGGIDYLK